MALTLGDDMDMIIEHLYIGNNKASEDSVRLQKLGVTLIVQVVAGVILRFPNLFLYKTVEIIDDPNQDLIS